MLTDLVTMLFSPYQLNPANDKPPPVKLFLSATNVTGKLKTSPARRARLTP